MTAIEKTDLLSLDFSELSTTLKELPQFRHKQIYKWLNSGADFVDMTNIPLKLRTELAERFIAQPIRIFETLTAKNGTEKYLFSLHDGHIIEGVRMSYKYGDTLCVSTQVGCRMKCVFCASGREGLIRNLTAGEILGQVVAVNRYVLNQQKINAISDEQSRVKKNAERAITNIVLMGMGEPLDNYDNVTKFLRLVNAEDGMNISRRNISLSTSGIVPNMYRLADDGFSVNLTVSIHSAFDDKRAKLMPIAKEYSLREIVNACKYYFEKTGRRVIYEYVLIKEENDSPKDAQALATLTKGFPVHINLIMLNKANSKNLPSPKTDASNFLKLLTDLKISATLRRSMGSEIEGACGQLRNQYVGQKDPVSSVKKP